MTKNQHEGDSSSDASSSSVERGGSASLPVKRVLYMDGEPSVKKMKAAQESESQSDGDDSGSDTDKSDNENEIEKDAENENEKVAEKEPEADVDSESEKDAKNEMDAEKDANKEAEEEAEKEATRKTVRFQRRWSRDDEIVLLRGMIEYQEVKGVHPQTDSHGFYEFIRRSLEVNVDREQMMAKTRKLKSKYMALLAKRKVKMDPEAVALSEKIWPRELKAEEAEDQVEAQDEEETEEGILRAPVLFAGKLAVSMGLLSESTVKIGLSLCSDAEKADLEAKWKRMYSKERRLCKEKLALAGLETKIIVKALKSKGKVGK